MPLEAPPPGRREQRSVGIITVELDGHQVVHREAIAVQLPRRGRADLIGDSALCYSHYWGPSNLVQIVPFLWSDVAI